MTATLRASASSSRLVAVDDQPAPRKKKPGPLDPVAEVRYQSSGALAVNPVARPWQPGMRDEPGAAPVRLRWNSGGETTGLICEYRGELPDHADAVDHAEAADRDPDYIRLRDEDPEFNVRPELWHAVRWLYVLDRHPDGRVMTSAEVRERNRARDEARQQGLAGEGIASEPRAAERPTKGSEGIAAAPSPAEASGDKAARLFAEARERRDVLLAQVAQERSADVDADSEPRRRAAAKQARKSSDERARSERRAQPRKRHSRQKLTDPMVTAALGEYKDVAVMRWVAGQMWKHNVAGARDAFVSAEGLEEALQRRFAAEGWTVANAAEAYERMVAEHGKPEIPPLGAPPTDTVRQVPVGDFVAWLRDRQREVGSKAELARRTGLTYRQVGEMLAGRRRSVRVSTVERALTRFGGGETFADLYGHTRAAA